MKQTTPPRLASLLAATTAAILGLPGIAQATLTIHTAEAAWQSAVTAPTLIHFDELADGTPVDNQYAGLSFSAFNGGNPLAVAYSFTQSGPNILSLGTPPLTGGGGGVAVDFGAPLQGVAFWYLDSEIAGSSVTVYGAGNLVLGSFELAFPHPAEWSFVGFSSTAYDITRIEVAIDAADMVALDSLQLAAAVPEPQTWAMLMAGLLWLGHARRSRAA